MATAYSTDPQYQQWLATLGFLQEDAKRQEPVATGRILDSADFAREGIGIDRDEALRGIGYAMENRGLTRSGEHERRRAESLRDSTRRFGALEMQTANQLADTQDNLASQLARYQMQDADRRFGAAGRAGREAGRA